MKYQICAVLLSKKRPAHLVGGCPRAVGLLRAWLMWRWGPWHGTGCSGVGWGLWGAHLATTCVKRLSDPLARSWPLALLLLLLPALWLPEDSESRESGKMRFLLLLVGELCSSCRSFSSPGGGGAHSWHRWREASIKCF